MKDRLISTLFCMGLFFYPAPPADAGIVRIIISQTSPAFDGRIFEGIGAYQKITGKAYGEVDPSLPQNARITDLQLAPRNARGMVEYSMDFYILTPKDARRGNHKLFVEIPNRGGKLFGGFDNSAGGNEPRVGDQKEEGFLMRQGYSIAWCGWDISAGMGSQNMTITVPVARNPDGSSITGLSYEYISFDNEHSSYYRLAYPPASPGKDSALLTVRALLDDPSQPVPPSGWEYGEDQSIRLLPAGTVFRQSAIYEFTYIAKDPLVAGLGLASTRDMISFLRYAAVDGEGHPNPLAGLVTYAYSFAISQPARYMNDFQTLGFNVDEQGLLVFDGIENWLGGASGVNINIRFAQPGRTERNRQNHLYPEAIFPFAYPALNDPYSNRKAGRQDGYRSVQDRPKVMEINSANEYWVKAASLLHTDGRGNDLPDPENVRFYLASGMQHGSGHGKGICQQEQNPTRAEPLLRALFVDLDEWVTRGRKPPDSEVPRHSDGTAVLATVDPGHLTGTVSGAALGWPDIPGVTYTGLVTVRYLFDYGPHFDQGIISSYPHAPFRYPVYPNFVSRVDRDGNEVAGIRLPPVAAPVATLTGWALRSAAFGLNDGGESGGQCIPFARTKAERLVSGDPRLSLEERYGTHTAYVDAVTRVAKELEAKRFLLEEDVTHYIEEARSGKVLH